MGKASRDKGKRGERMLSSFLREHGYEARRTSQYCGQTGDASDVVGLPGLHIECKFVERLNVAEALRQAMHDAKPSLIPVVFHKRSREEWLVTMRGEDFMKIYPEWEAGRDAELSQSRNPESVDKMYEVVCGMSLPKVKEG
ncbi:MAG: hypothetical protein IKU94_00830 [Bacteroidaceae bacterium]|nr:hypothetical protein [Bacteroidaceae bacterium]MBR4930420.1 hypothetical protein [Bacteroidaceae bacterium]